MQEVARHETVGRVDTDNHDGLLMPDGSVWLIGYEPNARHRQDRLGHPARLRRRRRCSSTGAPPPHADETTAANPDNPDYAHINSIDVQANGDVVASFRHFGSVWRIAGAGPPRATRRTTWSGSSAVATARSRSLPGEDGPCAQHTATVLPNGNVLMFDNGGNLLFGARCVDQDDPWGPLVDRSSTRVVEWDIDEVAGTATVADAVRRRRIASAAFAGGAYKLANGNVLIAWTPSRLTIANEVSADDAPVWELVDTAPENERYVSYRAQLVTVPDRIDPVVTLDGPADGTSVAQGSTVPVSFSCTDRGGSTLQACDGPAGRRLDTSTAGTHTWSVTARDGAGRTSTASRSYTVIAATGGHHTRASDGHPGAPARLPRPLRTPARRALDRRRCPRSDGAGRAVTRARRTGRPCAGPGAQRGRHDGPVPAPGARLGRQGLRRRQLRLPGARTHPSTERSRLAHSRRWPRARRLRLAVRVDGRSRRRTRSAASYGSPPRRRPVGTGCAW